MTPTQIETLLTPWLDHWRTIDGTFEAEAETHGAHPEAPFWKAVYSLFDAYTEQLATQLGDTDHWLHWFIYDNDAGANAYPASQNRGTRSKRIRTLKDLAQLLAINTKRETKIQKTKAAIQTAAEGFDMLKMSKLLKKHTRLLFKHHA